MAHSQAADTNNLGVLEHPIVLRHPAISEQLSVVSRLLCTSKTVGAALCNHAAGQLVMDMELRLKSSETAELSWLSRNSGLVKSLILRTGTGMPCHSSAEVQELAHVCSRYSNVLHSLELGARLTDTDTVEQLAAVVSEHGAKLTMLNISWTEDTDDFMLWQQLLADAMQQAATTAAGSNSKPCLDGMQYAQPPGHLPAPAAAPQQQQQPGELVAGQTGVSTAESDSDFPRLPNLQSFGTFYQASAALLEYLPATLTELSFDITDEDVTQLKAALGRLTNLQSLRIAIDYPNTVNLSSVVAQLPVQSLTSLTMLELCGLQDVSFADMLPAALRRLEVTTTSDAVVSPLVIGQLTQLTHLYFRTTDYKPPGIMAGSALPASLEQLHCFDIAPNVLTGLANLTKLALSCG